MLNLTFKYSSTPASSLYIIFILLLPLMVFSHCGKDKDCGFEKDIADCILDLFPSKEKVFEFKDLDDHIISFEFSTDSKEDYEVNFDFSEDCYQYQKSAFELESTENYKLVYKADSRPIEQSFSISFINESNNSESLFIVPTFSDCKYMAPDEGSSRIIEFVWIGDVLYEDVIRIENQKLYNDTDTDDNGMFNFIFLTQDYELLRLESTTELWEIIL